MEVSTILQVAGTTLLTVAFGAVFLPAGFFFAGAALVVFGIAIEKAGNAK